MKTSTQIAEQQSKYFSCAGRPSRPWGITSWGIIDQGTYALNPNHRRCIMKVSRGVDFHLQYHRANSK